MTRYTPAQRAAALARLTNGEPVWRIARWLGCSHRSVQTWARVANHPRIGRRAQPAVTRAVAVAIYTRWATTSVTSAALAAEHNYRDDSMRRLLRRMHRLIGTGGPTWAAERLDAEPETPKP